MLHLDESVVVLSGKWRRRVVPPFAILHHFFTTPGEKRRHLRKLTGDISRRKFNSRIVLRRGDRALFHRDGMFLRGTLRWDTVHRVRKLLFRRRRYWEVSPTILAGRRQLLFLTFKSGLFFRAFLGRARSRVLFRGLARCHGVRFRRWLRTGGKLGLLCRLILMGQLLFVMVLK